MTITSPTAATPTRWPTAIQVLVAVAALFASSFSALLVLGLPPVAELARTDRGAPIVIVLGWVGRLLPLLVAVVIVGVLVRLDGRRRLADIGWRWDRRSLPALGIGLAAAAVAVLGAALPLAALGLTRTFEIPGRVAEANGAPLWTIIVSQLLIIVTLQAVPEELIFRGYLLRSLRTRPVIAIVISSLGFGLLHLISSGGQQNLLEHLLYLAMPLGFGFTAAVLTLRLDSLWAAIGVHAGFHLAYRAALLLGLGDGPWLWVGSGVLFGVISFLVWRIDRTAG